MALAGLRSIFKPGYQFKKAGVMVSEIEVAGVFQEDLFNSIHDNNTLMTVLDTVNRKYGNGTLN